MYKKTVLPNGLRIITHDMKQRDSIAVGLWIAAGGRYEPEAIKGAAHFLEHIIFKGSRKYSCEQIKELIEGVGGTLNAFTSEEQTCFYAKIPTRHFHQTFDVLTDMVFHPLIPAKEMVKEKGVILEEIKMYRDLPQYFVLELLDALLWPSHPLGQNLTGTPQTISPMRRQDLQQFHDTYYTPPNIVISVCGHLRHPRLVHFVQQRLGNIQTQGRHDYIKANNVQNQPRVHFFKKQTEQMHLALGMLGLDENHKDRYVLSLLSTILGGNMSSRLFVEIREKKGLAYSISSSAKTLHDTGEFLIRAGVDNRKVIQAVSLILKELEKIKRYGVHRDEFRRAKDYLLGQLLLGLEDTMEHMLWMGEALVARNRVQTLQSVIREFRKIRKEDIKRVAKDILQENHYNLAMVGPLTESQQKQLNRLVGLKS